MTKKKIMYEDDKVYRKNIDLKGSIIKIIDSLADAESRDFKPYLEIQIEKKIAIKKTKK